MAVKKQPPSRRTQRLLEHYAETDTSEVLVPQVEAMRQRRANSVCYWCGIAVQKKQYFRYDFSTLEHVVPKAMGGTNDKGNVVIACKKCNNDRGTDMSWVPFSQHGEVGKQVKHPVHDDNEGREAVA